MTGRTPMRRLPTVRRHEAYPLCSATCYGRTGESDKEQTYLGPIAEAVVKQLATTPIPSDESLAHGPLQPALLNCVERRNEYEIQSFIRHVPGSGCYGRRLRPGFRPEELNAVGDVIFELVGHASLPSSPPLLARSQQGYLMYVNSVRAPKPSSPPGLRSRPRPCLPSTTTRWSSR